MISFRENIPFSCRNFRAKLNNRAIIMVHSQDETISFTALKNILGSAIFLVI